MHSKPGQETDMLGRIIRAAGRREPAPRETRDRVFAAASAALETKLGERRRRVTWRVAAAAAVAVVAVGIGYTTLRIGPALTVALSDQFIGEATFRSQDDEPWATMVRDRKLPAGSAVRTGQGGRVGLVMARGASLRLDELTEVRLVAPTRVEVIAGTVYVDSRVPGAAIEVVTPVAITRDVGTQFEVRYRESEQRVRVREGAVLVTAGDREFSGRAGEQLRLSPEGQLERAPIARDDPAWDWVQTVARTPDIDDQPLSVLLEWVGRETGRTIRFESPAVRDLARRTILHGSVRNMAPLPAIRTVLATTDLDLAILDDGSLLVKTREQGDRFR